MGLDITLGVLVLLAGIRGWFKGFVRQAIPIAALVGCVFLAAPLRDLGRPYARDYFPSINHDVLDRLLWWTSAVVAYVATAGIAFSIVKSVRKRTYGEPEPNRADQGAGFTLGVAKGLIFASCLASAMRAYAPGYYNQAPFVEDQAKASHAMEWAERYRPAETLWKSHPVQTVVAKVKTGGMWSNVEEKVPAIAEEKDEAPAPRRETAKPAPPTEPLRTASERPKTLALPRPGPDSDDIGHAADEFIRRELKRD
jgi:uncharacterized membrane protein required for colicin V production